MPMNACPRRTLAAGDLAVVEQCACGAVHLTIGAVTLRLAADAIRSLARPMHHAVRGLLLDQLLDPADADREAVS